ncbi:DUF1330 domain-containing protein [Yinghuangia seranimata]|uniref:DUF1330 domain-containing protein n=1 Tax=Yinghuangia seranimata TaxID=408067 RepID=UPI00248C99A4|nr:DUF1330 domain-containing protein [Yinghuangia seranimata]MDI2132552.1 DUF1330 domain-containing protein [Yinghuangia seranimata]
MTAYAFAHLRSVDVNEEIVEYLRRIDDTLTPYDGRFLIHNRTPEVVDGTFEGVLVLIEFPTVEAAKAWYNSDAYQAILAFRTNNSDGGACIVEGRTPDYRAATLADFITNARDPMS